MILPALIEAFNEQFKEKTPIQEALFERMADGESVFGLAPTGSGKTLAFALPVLSRIDLTAKQSQVLILAPSQELGAQLAQVIRPYASKVGVKVAALIGGANGKRQADKLKKEKPAVVVGTLGRVLTMIDGGALKTKYLKTLIVDEADATLVEEHAEDLEHLAAALPDLDQVALFSATSGVDLAWLERLFGKSVKPVSVGNHAPESIDHTYLHVDARANHKVLIELARRHQQALVFFNTIGALVSAQAALRHEHASVMSVGNNEKSHLKRADALKAFKSGKLDLLLATDVAARGLDIQGLPLVVNAQIPNNLTTYLHRTGRTGRAGLPGQVLNLGNDHDIRKLKQYLPETMSLSKFSWAKPTVQKVAERLIKEDDLAEDAQVIDAYLPKKATDQPENQEAGSKPRGPKTGQKKASRAKKAEQTVMDAKQAAKAKKKHQARKKKNKGKPKWAQGPREER
ncbi:superfamily II DNA/RNA helicase [Fructobacillus pseudoficulneus]|uniref:Superfamily II DNA/RNA helicase n=1 Tax=Fructobacillus pseudoficulneus TaxID=220714 RepID=A0A3F3GVW6_9LACO|nr:DEAD/DEAH box helicase [Fructobacillus pseudoficulneus]GAP02437.1 superfamily II DNA/RNA helicase [Fructobacillus pseudoficulneus]SEH36888.1 Superfamily II DNA and RNA helicase [Fructobacillus pseudoficulneus]